MNMSTVLKIATIITNMTKDGGMPLLEQDVMLADIFAKGLGLRYQMVQSGDGGLGRLLPDGNWTGVVGMILRGKADLAPYLGVSEERFEVLSFGFPTLITQMTFITHKPQLLPPTYAFVRPFTTEVWSVLFITIIIMSVIFYGYHSELYKYETVILTVFGSLLRQSWTLKTDTISKSTMLITWLVGTMFTTFAYTAVILSFLTFPPRAGIRDIAGLSKAVSEGTHQCITLKGSFLPDALLMSEDESLRLLGRNLKKNPENSNVFNVLEPPENKLIYFGARSSLMLLKDRYFVAEDDLLPLLAAPAYGKNFCCKDKLNDVILRATAAGLFDKVFSDRYFTTKIPQLMKLKPLEDTDTNKLLSLSDVWAAFVVLFIGYIFAFLIYLIEILHHKSAKKCNI